MSNPSTSVKMALTTRSHPWIFNHSRFEGTISAGTEARKVMKIIMASTIPAVYNKLTDPRERLDIRASERAVHEQDVLGHI
jgi:hypothetical protein